MENKAETEKTKRPHKKRSKKFWILLILLLFIVAVSAFFLLRPMLKEKKETTQNTATVSRGNIIRTIEGSGVIAANDQYTISSLVTGEVLSDTFEEGDMVNKDDLLYVIDSTNLDSNIKKAESGVETARLSYEEALETLSHQTVTAPISGVISTLSVKEGDEIANGAKVAEIIDASRMLLTIPFLETDAENISPGDAATIVPENAPSQTLAGTVQTVSSGSIANSLGVLVRTVEILVDNPGGITDGSRATAFVGTYACNEIGSFTYEAMESVTVKTSGTVTGLSVHAGDRIESGAVLFKLTSESTARSIERSRISYNDAITSRDNTYDQLEDYKIKAPISGKVIQKTVKAGDKLENGSGSNASSMAIIADLSLLRIEVAVDELDISDIKEGQNVQITADAVEGRIFSGVVDKVSIVGTTANGVTTYPVTVVLDGEENAALIPGMNVNATIVIEQKNDILLIPTSAVSRGNLVAVKGAGMPSAPGENTAPPIENNVPQNKDGEKTKPKMPAASDTDAANQKAAERAMQMDAPDGFHYVRIQTGITDGNFIEVVSGLSEGDIILLPDSKGSADSPVVFTRGAQGGMPGMGMSGMGGGMGGMGGGMPNMSGMRR